MAKTIKEVGPSIYRHCKESDSGRESRCRGPVRGMRESQQWAGVASRARTRWVVSDEVRGYKEGPMHAHTTPLRALAYILKEARSHRRFRAEGHYWTYF